MRLNTSLPAADRRVIPIVARREGYDDWRVWVREVIQKTQGHRTDSRFDESGPKGVRRRLTDRVSVTVAWDLWNVANDAAKFEGIPVARWLRRVIVGQLERYRDQVKAERARGGADSGTYRGASGVVVDSDGLRLPSSARQDRHTWGYRGTGPRELTRALLLDATADPWLSFVLEECLLERVKLLEKGKPFVLDLTSWIAERELDPAKIQPRVMICDKNNRLRYSVGVGSFSSLHRGSVSCPVEGLPVECGQPRANWPLAGPTCEGGTGAYPIGSS